MRRVTILTAVLMAAVAACGGDDAAGEPTSQGTSETTAPPSEPSRPTSEPTVPSTTGPSVPPASEPSVPSATDPTRHGTDDDVVIEYATLGGIRAPDPTFLDAPTLVITGDGRVIERNWDENPEAPPVLTTYVQRTIGDGAIAEIVALADEEGLLGNVEYADREGVYDAQSTNLRITVDGVTYEHGAYALTSEDDESDADRAALARFTDALFDLEVLVDADELGDQEPFRPDELLVRARPDRGTSADEPPVAWPDGAVALSDALECVPVSLDELEGVLSEASPVTPFTDDGVTYTLDAVPALPGTGC